ncbi:conserved hypothetical protein [Mesorhizobium prunaredense]|uniref:Uncharacterized protein n=1 Tax=Mesorhizobium prunaredense TaxID=1631249 RepID=A0A1R3UZ15_9HYPH|nr:conserved hypothetical protein [Mesorhizobium prunaredense]
MDKTVIPKSENRFLDKTMVKLKDMIPKVGTGFRKRSWSN